MSRNCSRLVANFFSPSSNLHWWLRRVSSLKYVRITLESATASTPIAAIETIYTPIMLLSGGRAYDCFQWLLYSKLSKA